MHPLVPAILFTAQFESSTRPGMLDLLRQIGPMGWFVAGTLVAMSLASWAIMLGKFAHFRRATRQTRDFLEVFRRSQRFSEVATVADELDASPLVGLFRAGHVEIDSQVHHLRVEVGKDPVQHQECELVCICRAHDDGLVLYSVCQALGVDLFDHSVRQGHPDLDDIRGRDRVDATVPGGVPLTGMEQFLHTGSAQSPHGQKHR